MRTSITLTIWLLLILGGALAVGAQPRARLSFNADWRFHKDDPPGSEGQLAYDKIKPWVIATGNEFLSRAGSPGLSGAEAVISSARQTTRRLRLRRSTRR